ncbi:Gfo/Idh/MocA family protein [Cohnella sp. GCM10020058]|uniref:Gfo/Idh/MocA family protein n=1 Tax=Cohnella sp. GCM10020058 TaxID=3317330 RepID=UPI003627EA16
MNVTTSDAASASRDPVTVVIVGAGSRAMNYASYALKHPDAMRIVGVVEPNPVRRAHTASLYDLPADRCFDSVDALVSRPQLADAVINGTLDAHHVRTTLPLLRKGYDVLLEKPVGISEAEVLALYWTAETYGRKVMVCHVLRYAPFYQALNHAIQTGEIGDVIHVHTEENVDYHHMATAFVRGKFASLARDGSSFLMAKCCHDLDLISWFKTGIKPVRVSSFGRLSQFREDRAPEGAGTRCVTDCPIEAACPYSAKTLYVDRELWPVYVWPGYLDGVRLSDEEKLASLAGDNRFGRYVWRCDNDIVDHQVVQFAFEDGSTAAHSLVGGAAKACRTVHITGTRGEIQGELEEGVFVVRHPDPWADGRVFSEREVRIEVSGEMHGGGDHRLVEDFLRVVRGDPDAGYSTALAHSIVGHVSGFRADVSMATGRTVEIDWDGIFV